MEKLQKYDLSTWETGDARMEPDNDGNYYSVDDVDKIISTMPELTEEQKEYIQLKTSMSFMAKTFLSAKRNDDLPNCISQDMGKYRPVGGVKYIVESHFYSYVNKLNREKTGQNEPELLERINTMCEESLSPEVFEKWQSVKEHLKSTRKNLK